MSPQAHCHFRAAAIWHWDDYPDSSGPLVFRIALASIREVRGRPQPYNDHLSLPVPIMTMSYMVNGGSGLLRMLLARR